MCLAIPGCVVGIGGGEGDFRLGRVDFGGIVKEVNLGLVPDARVGDYVLVHVGFAISRVDEGEARKTFEYLEEIEAITEELAGGT